MFVSVIVVVIVFIGHCDPLSVKEFSETIGACGLSLNEHFLSRADARANEFPWNAQLFFTFGEGQRKNVYCEQTLTDVLDRIDDVPAKSHSFGEGTLISPNYVLTAAQCLILPPLLELPATLSFVRLGKWNKDSQSIIDVPVAKYITHNQYDVSAGQNDIGLVKLQSNVFYSDSIRPICLPLSEKLRMKSDVNDELISTGWGETENEKCSHQKQKGKLNIVPSQTCAAIFQNVFSIGDGHVCAGGRIPYDTCTGNIGAPLMAFDCSSSHWLQIGIISRRESCAGTGIPGVYTHVQTYVNWIVEHMESRNIIFV